jgi:hypothetical protein
MVRSWTMSRSSSAKAAIMVNKNFPSPVGQYVPDSLPRTAPFGSRLRRSQAITASASPENQQLIRAATLG